MYANYTFCIVRYQCQSMLHGVKARLATVSQEVSAATVSPMSVATVPSPLGEGKAVLLAKLPPIVLLCFGKHKDYL
jgi:hypothetical protein